MENVINYLVLPKEVSPTERAHVERINRIALVGFFLHIPVFALVAWLSGTGPGFAVALSLLTLVGPTIAYYRLRDHRLIATVFGFTAMCMGGLLVHFGQGPMQIEMHFYFFVLLALLATYANPVVNLTAAATAAIHHLLLWILLPASVFNYDASVWVVLVHALFVVLETVAAVFIARSFYDNVIGLEKIVAARTKEVDARNRDMRLVLDHVSQGLLTIDLQGRFGSERSRLVDAWLGAPPASHRLVDWIEAHEPRFAQWLDIGLQELVEDILPREVVLDQLPSRLQTMVDGETRTFDVGYRPIVGEGGDIERILIVMTDMTDALRQAEIEAQQKENLNLFELLGNDASGFQDFYEEASKLVRRVVDDAHLSLDDVKRLVHTLKGNCALFGLDRISKRCHELEDQIDTSGERPSKAELDTIDLIWMGIADKVTALKGGDTHQRVLVHLDDIEGLHRAIRSGRTAEELELRVTRMRLEPSSKRLEILAQQANKIATRLGRENIKIEHRVEGDLRLDPARWTSFWSSLVHVLRNAVDHGLEPQTERLDAGKEGQGCLELRTYAEGDRLVLEIADDGRGIDLAQLEDKARAMGFDVETPDEVLRSVFIDGLSTRNAVTETSGRGVGLAAVKTEVEALGGEVAVESELGRGTRFAFSFPMDAAARPLEETPTQRASL